MEEATVEVRIDEKVFDKLQMELAHAITHEVYTAMKRSGVADSEALEENVAQALFGIGVILDGSQVLETAEGPMEVLLTFRGETDRKTLISAGGSSWIHEGAQGVVEDYFVRVKAKPAQRVARPPVEEPRLNLLDVIPSRWFTRRRQP
jgi:hypothetical protein